MARQTSGNQRVEEPQRPAFALPPELLDEVLHHFTVFDKPDHRALSRACLVSRLWADLARRRLYERLELSTEDSQQRTSLSQTLQQAHISPLVRVVEILRPEPPLRRSAPAPPFLFANPLQRVLDSCTRLHTLRVHLRVTVEDAGDILASCIPHWPRLRRLAFRAGSAALSASLIGSPPLRARATWSQTVQFSRPFPSIRLVITPPSHEPYVQVLPFLTIVRVPSFDPAPEPPRPPVEWPLRLAHIAPVDALTSSDTLSLELDTAAHGGLLLASTHLLLRSTPCTTQRLSLSLVPSSADTSVVTPLLALLDILPSALRTLTLRGIPPLPRRLLVQRLRRPAWLPQLETLELAYAEGRRDDCLSRVAESIRPEMHVVWVWVDQG